VSTDASSLGERVQRALGSAYVLERELGAGGKARVFLARDTRLSRRVVIKVLDPALITGVSGARFEREVTLAARLQHPNVVPLLSAGVVDGLAYYTMPFVEGESLRARLRREGPLPVDDVLRLVRELADALACAHAEGIVHRDLKPDNVLLSHGHAVVADFGVGKALAAATRRERKADGTLTSAGVALGTPTYMAPEQALADPTTDHRADLYSLGVVAYELLAGVPPFSGRAPRQLVFAHITAVPPSLAEKRPDAPDALVRLIGELLAKEPSARPQSAIAVVSALDALSVPGRAAATADAPARAHSGRGHRRAIMVTIVVLGIVIAALSAYVAWRRAH